MSNEAKVERLSSPLKRSVGLLLRVVRLMLKVIVLILALLTTTVAQDNLSYDCPRGDRVLPASCLEEMKIKDVSRILTVKERHQVAYLFAKSYVVAWASRSSAALGCFI